MDKINEWLREQERRAYAEGRLVAQVEQPSGAELDDYTVTVDLGGDPVTYTVKAPPESNAAHVANLLNAKVASIPEAARPVFVASERCGEVTAKTPAHPGSRWAVEAVDPVADQARRLGVDMQGYNDMNDAIQRRANELMREDLERKEKAALAELAAGTATPDRDHVIDTVSSLARVVLREKGLPLDETGIRRLAHAVADGAGEYVRPMCAQLELDERTAISLHAVADALEHGRQQRRRQRQADAVARSEAAVAKVSMRRDDERRSMLEDARPGSALGDIRDRIAELEENRTPSRKYELGRLIVGGIRNLTSAHTVADVLERMAGPLRAFGAEYGRSMRTPHGTAGGSRSCALLVDMFGVCSEILGEKHATLLEVAGSVAESVSGALGRLVEYNPRTRQFSARVKMFEPESVSISFGGEPLQGFNCRSIFRKPGESDEDLRTRARKDWASKTPDEILEGVQAVIDELDDLPEVKREAVIAVVEVVPGFYLVGSFTHVGAETTLEVVPYVGTREGLDREILEARKILAGLVPDAPVRALSPDDMPESERWRLDMIRQTPFKLEG